ncbi:hypothetical protein [Cupriavidus basilensis]|uniref:hypothetical protein n=1 Tax=Cupriavidus basilensis TaxID=68895 RepID=UPI0002D7E3E8|nr:hypothetical protein [Cupriavidus basilensis]
MSRIVVERSFATPQSDDDMKIVADRERPCLALYNVTWKRSLIAADRKRMPTASAWFASTKPPMRKRCARSSTRRRQALTAYG